MSVKNRLLLAFGAMVLVVLSVSLFAQAALSTSHETFTNYVRNEAARMGRADALLEAVEARAIAARNLLLVTTSSDIALEKAAVTAAHEAVVSRLAELTQAVEQGVDISAREREIIVEMNAAEALYGPVALDIVGKTLAGQRDEAIQKLIEQCRPLLARLLRAGHDYVKYLSDLSIGAATQADADLAGTRWKMVVGGLIAVLLAGGLAVFISRSLLRALGAEPVALGAAAHRIAAGDLGNVHGAINAPPGSVLSSLGDMQVRLAELVGQVRLASESIASSSVQIATGNADLSQRTERQASSLQETAASMDEIGKRVRQNANSALQAKQLATAASQVAESGGQVVTEVVSTMGEITSSSTRIADIISVIDGIAFQTNILALNAAVEAARAGEQGRGFAVVANEVRGLASRSTSAAREIKSLIEASVNTVENGSTLVARAGTTMADIVAQARGVSGLIGDISASTTQQATGIDAVAASLAQLDRVTQQNTALVEESAASADELRQNAERLAQTVRLFRLQGDAAASS